MRCPECGYECVQSFGKRNWQYPVAFLAIIPTVFAMLHQAASPIDYRCPACGLLFGRRSTAARVALLVIIFVLVAMTMLAAFFFLRSRV